METVALIPGSREELFGQGHSRSELVGFYWKKASVCSVVLFFFFFISWISLCRRRRRRRNAEIFREEVTCGVNADEAWWGGHR